MVATLAVAMALTYAALATLGPWDLWAQLARGPDPGELVAVGAKVNRWVLEGQIERLLVSAFVHATPVHLAINLFTWLGLALVLLRVHHGTFVVAVWCVGSIAGQALSVAFGLGPSVGASSGLFGLIGVGSAWLLHNRAEIPEHLRRPTLVALAVAAILALVTPMFSEGVDHAAHFGGLIAGFVCGYTLVTERAQRVLAWVSVALMLGAAALAPRGERPPVAPGLVRIGDTGPSLPRGTVGRLVEGRCRTGSEVLDSAPWCTTDGIEFVAAEGATGDLLAQQIELAALVPPPGRCRALTVAGENMLLIRSESGATLTVLATPTRRWHAHAASRAALRSGRCPGTRSPAPASRSAPRGSDRRR